VAADCERFGRFYKNKHEGRKLTWLWQLCKGEVKANYVKSAKMPYTFQVSIYQMAILLLFNEKDKNTYEEIASTTQLNSEALDPSLGILLKAKVLNLDPGSSAKIGPGASFSLNYDFKNKKYRVNLNVGMKSETKQEEAETNKTIEEDRKLLLQVFPLFLSRTPNGSVLTFCVFLPVGHRAHHEGAQAHEAPAAGQRDHQPDPRPLRAQGQRHQEVHRDPARQGVPRAV
jgi:hypothetical protein